MTLYARLDPHASTDEVKFIHEYIDFDPTGKFHPDIVWVEIPEELAPYRQFIKAVDATNAPILDLDAYRAALRNQVSQILAAQRAGGVTVDFGTAVATLPDGTTEPAGKRVLQTRPDDITNWQGTLNVAAMYAATPDEPMRYIRTEDDVHVAQTAGEVLVNIGGGLNKFGAMMERSHALKNTLTQATTLEELDLVVEEFATEWPVMNESTPVTPEFVNRFAVVKRVEEEITPAP